MWSYAMMTEVDMGTSLFCWAQGAEAGSTLKLAAVSTLSVLTTLGALAQHGQPCKQDGQSAFRRMISPHPPAP